VPALLESEHLTVAYAGGVTALNGLDLEVPDSGITCLLGANGAGKTTLLESAAGLVKASSGSLRVLGTDPGSPRNRLQVGVMLQDGGMPGSARPREFLDYVSRLYPKPRDVRSLLEAVEIAPDTRAPIRRLSGGQQRRISWAAAMVGNPRSLLLDEPTASIDPVGRERLYDVLRAERDQGVSMIVATHLIEDVESLADHIVVVRDGRVALTGTPDELRPRNTLIVRSTREMDATALLSALPSGSTCQRTGPDSYHVDVPTGIDPAVMATVSSWCGQHSVPPDLSVGDLRAVLWSALRGEVL
jgi:ABC-2 type transport system ATP-binding protein